MMILRFVLLALIYDILVVLLKKKDMFLLTSNIVRLTNIILGSRDKTASFSRSPLFTDIDYYRSKDVSL
jgi:hypothetical protein